MLAVHVVIWTVVPSLVNRVLPLDTLEALAWGRQWEWGYDKHPPLSAWMLEGMAQITGRGDWAIYLLSQLFICATLILTYQLARTWWDIKRSIVAVLVLEGICFFNFTTPEFNVNVVQMPFWAGAFLAYWRALQTGKLKWWVLLGACVGLALLGKYLGGVMLVPMLLYAVWHPRRRAIWTSAGPYVAAAICTAITLPHLLWMIDTDFATLSYGLRRASLASADKQPTWIDHLLIPLLFLLKVAAILSPAIILYLFARPQSRQRIEESPQQDSPPHLDREARVFINTMALGPLAVLVLLSFIEAAKLKTMWVAPMVSLIGLLLMLHFPSSLATLRNERLFLFACVTLMLVANIAYSVTELINRFDLQDDRRTAFPGRQLAAQITEQWHDHFGVPLSIVIAEEWLGGNICWYSADRPALYLSADPQLAPWLSDDQVHKQGAVVIWRSPVTNPKTGIRSGDLFAETLAKRFANFTELPSIELDWARGKSPVHYTLRIALIPPAANASLPAAPSPSAAIEGNKGMQKMSNKQGVQSTNRQARQRCESDRRRRRVRVIRDQHRA